MSGTLPTVGPISASMIEAVLSTSGAFDVSSPDPRLLANVLSGPIKWSDFLGQPQSGGFNPVAQQLINITHVSASQWSSWMNSRAIIFTTEAFAADYWANYQGISWLLTLTQTGTYTMQFQVDDQLDFWVDASQIITGTTDSDNFPNASPSSITFGLSAGEHVFTVGVLNAAGPGSSWSDNPTGVGFIILNPDGSVLQDSATLSLAYPAVGNGYTLTTLSDGSIIGIKP